MAYKKTDWRDKAVERPRTYHSTNNPDGTITLTPEPGTVYEEGTRVNAAHLNNMEQGIWDAYWQSGATPLVNATTTLHNDEQGNLVRVDESVGGVLRRRTVLTYVDGSLATSNVKLYAEDGITVEREWTDTVAMPNITRVVIK